MIVDFKTKILVLLFVLLLCISNVDAASLKWDEVVAPAGIKPVLGYIVYYKEIGDSTEVYNYNVGNVTTYSLDKGSALNLSPGTQYEFYVTVYNADGESPPSNTVDWVVPNATIPEDNVPDLVIKVPDSSTLNVIIRRER